MNWMTAFLWRLQTRKSYRALWLTPSSLSSSASRNARLRADEELICSRRKSLLGGWTSGFSASLDGCAPGLPGQDARQWGSRSGFSLSQGPEERDRPGSTHHQSHRPSHRAFDVQPDSVGAPPLAHDDKDERGRQSSLPRRSGLVRQPVWTSCGGLCWTLHRESEVVSGDATLPPKTHQLFLCFQSPQTCADSADS